MLEDLVHHFPSINIYQRRAPCFYAKRSKTDQRSITEDYVTVSKFESYFGQLHHLEPFPAYPQLLTDLTDNLRDLEETLGLLLVGVLDIEPPQVDSVEGSSNKCYATDYPNQARSLIQLQNFLKDYLASDITTLEKS